MADSRIRRLKEFDSVTPLELTTYAPGTYERPLLIEGNSLLSTVFVESIDVGATLEVSYYDYTTGADVGEMYLLNAHRLMDSPMSASRISVTKIHNKPIVRCVVTGGSCKFSVYITVVSSFASDLDDALQYDGAVVDYLRDKGMPVMGLDRDTGNFNFIQSNDGRLLVEIVADTREINKRIYAQSLAVIPDTPLSHISYTVPAGKRFIWISGFGASDCPSEWRVKIDSANVLTRRSTYDQREVKLSLDYAFILDEGQSLEVIATNKSFRNQNAELETWIYGFEETI